MMTKLLIDTDPGVDDAMAIYMAARLPNLEIVGLTTVFGNVNTPTATRNALTLLERAGISAPVAQGASKPLELPPFEPPVVVHGEEGFGALPAETPKAEAVDEDAVAFLCRMASEHKGELVVCPVGPITNIAEAIRRDPSFAKNVKRIVFMGGALDCPGNITPYAEANTYHDPHALKIVLESGADILMVGLDVTLQVLLDKTDFETLEQLDPDLGGHLKAMGDYYLAFYQSIGLTGCGLHDPLAVLACVEEDLVKTEKVSLGVVLDGEEIGRTYRAQSGPQIDVALQVDVERARELFFGAFGNQQAKG